MMLKLRGSLFIPTIERTIMRFTDHSSTSFDAGVAPKCILMLVPHEPKLDPRIKWVTGLCAKIGPTHIISFTNSCEEPLKEDDGIIHTDRVIATDYANNHNRLLNFYRKSTSSIWECIKRSNFTARLKKIDEDNLDTAFITNKQGSATDSIEQLVSMQTRYNSKTVLFRCLSIKTLVKRLSLDILEQIISVRRFILKWRYSNLIIQTLYHRAKANSIDPQVIICHDLLALAVGVKIKKRCNAPIIYDSHEYWPEADLSAKKWEKKITAFVERKLIRQADAVITVTPQLARHLENTYSISGVLSVSNAEPSLNDHVPSYIRPLSFPIKFLLQGQVAAGRGIEELLIAWSEFDDARAVLIIRAPENEYLVYLRNKYNRGVEKGRIIFIPPVTETELISAAATSDVGIIPYGGPSLNHIYACPNKLSQYMQAGLAILCNTDLEFVSSIISECDCGRTYNLSNLDDFVRVIRFFTDHPEKLQILKMNAYNFARTKFNWEVQSGKYKETIQYFYTSKRINANNSI